MGQNELENLLKWREVVKNTIPEGLDIWWPKNTGFVLENPEEKVKEKLVGKGPKSIATNLKLLYQIFCFFKIVDNANAEVVNDTIAVRQSMQCGVKSLDFMMPTSWGEPTIKLKTVQGVYSVWHEFSVPHPLPKNIKAEILANAKKEPGEEPDLPFLAKEEATKRFDIIVKKGDYTSFFPQKPDSCYT